MIGSAFVMSVAEMEALSGAGPMGTTVYLWLRAWMDFDTGKVGLSRTISLAMIATYCEDEVPKGVGVQRVKPSKWQIVRVIERLKSAGLLERKDTENLVFLLPLAVIGKPRQNQTRNKPATETRNKPATRKPAQLSEKEAHKRTEPAPTNSAEPATHQSTEVNPFSEYKKSNHQSVSLRIEKTEDFDFLKIPDDEVPKSVGDWVNHFAHEFAIPLQTASDRFARGELPILEGWIAGGVSIGRVRAIVGRAKASAGNRINNLLLYVNAGLRNDGGLERSVASQPRAAASSIPDLPPVDRETGKQRVAALKSLTNSLKRTPSGGRYV